MRRMLFSMLTYLFFISIVFLCGKSTWVVIDRICNETSIISPKNVSNLEFLTRHNDSIFTIEYQNYLSFIVSHVIGGLSFVFFSGHLIFFVLLLKHVCKDYWFSFDPERALYKKSIQTKNELKFAVEISLGIVGVFVSGYATEIFSYNLENHEKVYQRCLNVTWIKEASGPNSFGSSSSDADNHCKISNELNQPDKEAYLTFLGSLLKVDKTDFISKWCDFHRAVSETRRIDSVAYFFSKSLLNLFFLEITFLIIFTIIFVISLINVWCERGRSICDRVSFICIVVTFITFFYYYYSSLLL